MVVLVSCRREQRVAPDYDNSRTRLLLEACGDLNSSSDLDSLARWERLVALYPEEMFPAVACRLSQKRHLLSEADRLLANVELHRLIALIRDAEQEGTSCPELLSYSTYKDGLDQLRLFVSKMPWTDSRTLAENLTVLDRSSAVLSLSPLYVSFRANQERELARLRASESRQHALEVILSLDRSLVSGVGRGRSSTAFLELCSGEPEGFGSRCLRASSPQSLRELYGEISADELKRSCFEVMCHYRWASLGEVLRNEWKHLLSLKEPVTLSGGWICVRHGLRVDSDAVFLRLLTSGKSVCIPSQSIVRDLLGRRLLAAPHYQAWCWQSPCPGVTEILARLKQVGQSRQSQKSNIK